MNIQLFSVAPSIPKELHFLETLSGNMWWCWNLDAIELFRRIDPMLWRDSVHRPHEFLSRVPQKRLEALSKDDAYLAHLQEVQKKFEERVTAPPAAADRCVAYFSLEYGIHESLRFYSGGLGVLAGDHLKACSDLGLPLVAVGLLYRQGYFQQYLNSDGWQQESYPEIEVQNLPLCETCTRDSQPLYVTIPLPEGPLKALVWRLDVGRVPVFLLDTNIPENPPALRPITAQLYGGDRQIRLRQELLLGIGGFRALCAMGYDPHVCHMNEGHAAFMSLGRLAHLKKTLNADLDTVFEIARRSSVFTTHTPVPAGNETFHVDLVRPHLQALEPELGIAPDRVLAWAQPPGANANGELSMTVLGLRHAACANGVSELHGGVARSMWRALWPARAEDEIPIGHITNGVHIPSWLSVDNTVLFDRYLGPGWRDHPANTEGLSRIAHMPDEELWRAHELSRSRLVRTARDLVEKQMRARNSSRAEIAQAKSVLDHDSLTIGFARRFATYKRATLLLQDLERLEAILTNEDRPVQIIFAGKAHPADDHGKDLIRQILAFARQPRIRSHVVFLEDYDIYVARQMVQGVDVWLNTPRRPHEASGTSGMKAAVNGALHVSTLDGWWCEGYEKDNGWAIGHGEEYEDTAYQDAVESQALYNLLENEVIPCFYDRPFGDIPTHWVKMMKSAIRAAFRRFSSHRMVAQYEEQFYRPAREAFASLVENRAARARNLVKQRKRLDSLWHKVRIHAPTTDRLPGMLHVGDTLRITTAIDLGELSPDEVTVQAYYGPVDSRNHIVRSHFDAMELKRREPSGTCIYEREIVCGLSGRYGFTTRVTPAGNDWQDSMPGFVTWADDPA